MKVYTRYITVNDLAKDIHNINVFSKVYTLY